MVVPEGQNIVDLESKHNVQNDMCFIIRHETEKNKAAWFLYILEDLLFYLNTQTRILPSTTPVGFLRSLYMCLYL